MSKKTSGIYMDFDDRPQQTQAFELTGKYLCALLTLGYDVSIVAKFEKFLIGMLNSDLEFEELLFSMLNSHQSNELLN